MMRHSILILLASMALAGCTPAASTSPSPTTFAVRGKVEQKDGQPYTAGGAIQFKSTVDPARVGTGEIKPDGSFSINLVHENELLAGSIEGPHQVTIIGPSGAD